MEGIRVGGGDPLSDRGGHVARQCDLRCVVTVPEGTPPPLIGALPVAGGLC